MRRPPRDPVRLVIDEDDVVRILPAISFRVFTDPSPSGSAGDADLPGITRRAGRVIVTLQ